MAFTSSYTPGLIQQSEYIYGTPDVLLPGNISGYTATFTNVTASGDVLIGTASRTLNNNRLYIKEGDAGTLSLTGGNTVAIESNTTNYLGLFAPDDDFELFVARVLLNSRDYFRESFYARSGAGKDGGRYSVAE